MSALATPPNTRESAAPQLMVSPTTWSCMDQEPSHIGASAPSSGPIAGSIASSGPGAIEESSPPSSSPPGVMATGSSGGGGAGVGTTAVGPSAGGSSTTGSSGGSSTTTGSTSGMSITGSTSAAGRDCMLETLAGIRATLAGLHETLAGGMARCGKLPGVPRRALCRHARQIHEVPPRLTANKRQKPRSTTTEAESRVTVARTSVGWEHPGRSVYTSWAMSQ